MAQPECRRATPPARVHSHDRKRLILEIEVRGKRGVGYCKSMTGAVMPYERLRKRNNCVTTTTIARARTAG
jgi:hypothetical protein